MGSTHLPLLPFVLAHLGHVSCQVLGYGLLTRRLHGATQLHGCGMKRKCPQHLLA